MMILLVLAVVSRMFVSNAAVQSGSEVDRISNAKIYSCKLDVPIKYINVSCFLVRRPTRTAVPTLFTFALDCTRWTHYRQNDTYDIFLYHICQSNCMNVIITIKYNIKSNEQLCIIEYH